MYQNSPESKKQPEMFSSILGLNELHMKCFQEMYLGTCHALAACGAATGCPPNLPTTSSTETITATKNSLLSPSSLSPTPMSSNYSSSSAQSSGIGCNSLTALQQQQLIAVHQHHLAGAAMAQHQLALAAGNHESGNGTATTLQQHQDEISKSLKMFAMLTAYSNGHEAIAATPPQLPPSSSVDAVMQDFNCNGYICDELNCYQLGMHLANTAANGGVAGVNTTSLLTAAVNHHTHNINTATSNDAAAAAISQQQQLLQNNNVNLNFNNNFWKMLPAHLQQQSNAVTAAAAANIDYNSFSKKATKRYNGTKNEKYVSAKHCVFCENNSEPEEVVKSHSVRDSLGRVLCPKLRTYVCPICKASGDNAHTVKYCPQKPIYTMEDAIKAESFRLAKGTYYKQQMKV